MDALYEVVSGGLGMDVSQWLIILALWLDVRMLREERK